MTPRKLLTVVAALAVLDLATPGATVARGEEASPPSLTIAFTGDVSGYLEPCG